MLGLSLTAKGNQNIRPSIGNMVSLVGPGFIVAKGKRSRSDGDACLVRRSWLVAKPSVKNFIIVAQKKTQNSRVTNFASFKVEEVPWTGILLAIAP